MKSRTYHQRGMVTFELAVGILSASCMCALLVAGIFFASMQGQCNDTAAAIARYLGRGDDEMAKKRLENSTPRAAMDVDEKESSVEVNLRCPVHFMQISMQLTSKASAYREGS